MWCFGFSTCLECCCAQSAPPCPHRIAACADDQFADAEETQSCRHARGRPLAVRCVLGRRQQHLAPLHADGAAPAKALRGWGPRFCGAAAYLGSRAGGCWRGAHLHLTADRLPGARGSRACCRRRLCFNRSATRVFERWALQRAVCRSGSGSRSGREGAGSGARFRPCCRSYFCSYGGVLRSIVHVIPLRTGGASAGALGPTSRDRTRTFPRPGKRPTSLLFPVVCIVPPSEPGKERCDSERERGQC